MKILLLTNEYPHPSDSNADRTGVVGEFAREWVKQGHEVVVIVNSSAFPSFFYAVGNRIRPVVSKTFDVSQTPDTLWIKRFQYDDQGVYVENLPMTKIIPHGKFSARVKHRQIRKIIALLDQLNFSPDVVTGHWVNPQVLLIPALAEHYGAKSAFVFHADYIRKTCEKFGVQKYLDRIDHVGFRSGSAAQAAKEYLHLKEEPFLAASGIPDAFTEKFGSPPPRNYDSALSIITAARLVEYKKIDAIIDAAALAFPDQQFALTVAGSGPLLPDLQDRAAHAGIQKKVTFVGKIPRESLQERMRESDVFVLISRRETFGLVYLEAMLHGCIVIASRFGGVDGIIQDGVNGFLCEEGNAEALADILKRIRNMPPQEKSRVSRSAYDTAVRFTAGDVARRYLDQITR